MKFRWFFLLLVFTSGCHASIVRPKAAPIVVPDFPEPPQQQAKWDSDTNLISPELYPPQKHFLSKVSLIRAVVITAKLKSTSATFGAAAATR